MTTLYKDGLALPATVIALEEGNIVTQVKTVETDGYQAVQVGYQEVKEKKLTKPEIGHLKKAGVTPLRRLREFKLKDVSSFETGQALEFAELFKAGDLVDVAGTSIGKGFQGVVKRHNFSGVGGQTHGQHNRLRAPGSLGASSFPSRVFKGMRMAGQMGNVNVKVQNLQVVKVDAANNRIFLKGAVPGHEGNFLKLEK